MEAPARSELLLTGATGFIGGQILALLFEDWLRRPSSPAPLFASSTVPHHDSNTALEEDVSLLWTRLGKEVAAIHILVRADDDEAGRKRVLLHVSRFIATPLHSQLQAFLSWCHIVTCDLRSLTDKMFETLKAVTHVLHLASSTYFGRHLEATSNIDGTLNLVRATQKHCLNLVRFLHTGTALICGSKPLALVREDEYPCGDVIHLVDYTATKAAAEEQLESEISIRRECGNEGNENLLRDDRYVIVRPSVVVGHSRLGCSPSTSIYWLFRVVSDLNGLIWDPDLFIDVLPVDYSAAAMLFLLFKPSLSHNRYHISAGLGSRCTHTEIVEAMRAVGGGGVSRSDRDARLNPSERRSNSRSNPLRLKIYDDLTTLIEKTDGISALCGESREKEGKYSRLLLSAMRHYFKFPPLGVTFDNSRLLSENFPSPPPFCSYIPQCEESVKGISIVDMLLSDYETD